ncbi:hypothetical protein LJC14_05615 [Treponema sp. OttesenSCG-928-L16]|nr:hypothetical protein [Treponema sp. OttesenSCG-928-L16]
MAAYIIKKKLTNRGKDLDGVEGDLIDLREFIQTKGLGPSEELSFFS